MGEKKKFVEDLFRLYVNGGNQENISNMTYVKDGKEEYVLVDFGTNAYKRFSVWGDNPQGILIDFTNFLSNIDEYDWIQK